jgi:PBSX family phage terminase large subunit
MTLDESAYSSKFYNVIHSHDRYIIAFGGRGSGKTDSFYLKYLLELFQPYYFRLCYVNKEKANIRDQQYAGFKRVAKRIGIYDKLKFFDGDYRIINPANGNSLIPKGMDDPEKTKGLDDITAIWWDEINKGTLEDFVTLNALLRSPQAEYLQFSISFNPVSERSWLRQYFFSKENAYELSEEFAYNTLLSHSTYLDNEFIDQDAYMETLIQNAKGNKNKLVVDIKGLWGVLDNKNPFFYALSQIHKTEDEYIPDAQQFIDLSFDFNANPCTLVVGQHDRKNNTFHVFDYLTANQDTLNGLTPLEAVCTLFERIYIKSGITSNYKLRITGDASGQSSNADRQKNQNYYTTIQRILKVHLKSQASIRSTNLPHEISGDICNHALRTLQSRILFHTNGSVYHLFQEMESAQSDEKNTLNTWKKEAGGHGVDAVRYLFTDLWFKAKDWFNFIINIK